MDKEKALKAIEHFKYSANPVVCSPDVPATQTDIRKLKKQIAELAKKLVESISE